MTLVAQRKQKLLDFITASRMLDQSIELWINPTDFSFIVLGFGGGSINPEYLKNCYFYYIRI